MARLGPSGLAQLFREISTYVSKRLSDYSTKAELDSLLDAKADDDNVIHTSGNETINGVKTFTESIRRKNGSVDLTVTPTSDIYSHYLFMDKNDKISAYIENAQRSKGVNDLGLCVHDKNGGLHGVQITSNNEVLHLGNDTYSLGSPNNRWANVYATTFNGNLKGNADTATIANDPNAVHRSGNETINGVKYFNNLVYLHDNMSNKNSRMDLFTTPANTLYAHYMFVDKNDEVAAYMQYGQQNSGTDFIGLFIHDKNRALHGIQVTTNNEVIPFTNNTYSLGSSSSKWSDAYINKVVCHRFTHSVNDGSVYITGGSEHDKGATLVLHGEESSSAGSFIISSRDKTRTLYLVGKPDGTLQWAEQNIATTAYVKSQGYVTLNSLAGGNSAGSLKHSVGSLVLAYCEGTAFSGTTYYGNVAGHHLCPCRTEIYTSYSYGFMPIIVRSYAGTLGAGTWRYLGGSNLNFNNAVGEVYGMFLRVA